MVYGLGFQGSGLGFWGWMKVVWDETHWMKPVLDENVIGRNRFQMKMSLDVTILG